MSWPNKRFSLAALFAIITFVGISSAVFVYFYSRYKSTSDAALGTLCVGIALIIWLVPGLLIRFDAFLRQSLGSPRASNRDDTVDDGRR
jgi:membrane protease YdiL (CAAX protease family)